MDLANVLKDRTTYVFIVTSFIAGIFGFLIVLGFDYLVPLIIMAGLLSIVISLKSPFSILMLVVFLIPIGFFVMFSGATMNRYLSLVLLAGLTVNVVHAKKSLRLDRPVLLLAGWILYGLGSYLWAPTSERLAENIFGYLLAFLLLVAVVILVNSKKRLSWLLMAFMAGQLVYITIYYVTGDTNLYGNFLPTVGASQVSEYGTLVGLIIACFIPLLLYGKFSQSALAIAVLALSGYLFFATGLRRTIITTGFVTVVLLFSPKKIKWKPIILAAALFAIVWFGSGPIIDQLPISIQQRYSLDNVVSTGGTGRIAIYRSAIDLWLSNPVFGIGLGNFNYYTDNSFHYQPSVPHNVYLEILCETGIIGFLLWAAAFSTILWNTIKAFRSVDKYPDLLIASLPVAMMAYMLAGGMLNSMQNWRPLWLAMGLGIALFRISRENKQSRHQLGHNKRISVAWMSSTNQRYSRDML
jgi:O-antigen ligase